MSQPEQEMLPPPAPAGAPPAYHQPAEQEEPARLGPLQRLVGVIFSPGETYKDINRKPTWLVPMIIAVVAATLYWFFLSEKLEPGFQEFMRKTLTEQNQQAGRPAPSPNDIAMGLMIMKIWMVAAGALFTPDGDMCCHDA